MELPGVVARVLAALRNRSTVSSWSSEDMKLEVNLKIIIIIDIIMIIMNLKFSGVGECRVAGSRAEY